MDYSHIEVSKTNLHARVMPTHFTSSAQTQSTPLTTGYNAPQRFLCGVSKSDFCGLITGSEQTAEDALNAHLAGRNGKWLEL